MAPRLTVALAGELPDNWGLAIATGFASCSLHSRGDNPQPFERLVANSGLFGGRLPQPGWMQHTAISGHSTSLSLDYRIWSVEVWRKRCDHNPLNLTVIGQDDWFVLRF